MPRARARCCWRSPEFQWHLTYGGRNASLVLAFPVAFLLFIANTFPASRYLNPVLPFVAILGGLAVSWLVARGGAFRLAGATVAVLAVGEAGLASARIDAFFRQADTRSLALAWVEEHVPAETTVLVEPYSVPLRMSRDALTEALTEHLGSANLASIKFQRILALDPYPAPAYRAIYLGSGGLDVDCIYVDPADLDGRQGLAPLRALAVTHVILKRYNGPEPVRRFLEESLRTRRPFARGILALREQRSARRAEDDRAVPSQHGREGRPRP